MSDAEALMWNVEKDPGLRSAFLQVTFLDRTADASIFPDRISAAVEDIPRLRQRVVAPPARIAPPAWADDPNFDLDFHVRHVAVAGRGTDRQVLDLAAIHYQDPFDRARPLWDFTLVEGLDGGRGTLLCKLHHTVTDGVGGVRLSATFTDIERDPTRDRPHSTPPPAPSTRPAAGVFDELTDAIGHALRSQFGLTRRAASGLLDAARRPQQLAGAAGEGFDTLSSVVRQMLVTDRSKSPLWSGKRSLARRFEILSVPLDALKETSNQLGGTLNDGFVSSIAGGAAAYHRELGADVEELRMSMPVNTRTDRDPAGNAFSPTRVVLPVGIKSAAERFGAVHALLERTKRERSIRFTEAMAGVINNLPTSVLVAFARQQVETVDFATSNVKAAPFDLYIAGAEVLANHPMGPTGGTAFNATVMSYRNQMDVGIDIDSAAVTEPALLRDCIAAAFDELVATG